MSWIDVLIFIGFLFLSGFFSGSETAFTGVSLARMRTILDNRKRRKPHIIETILESPKRLITAILIGNNLANIGASVMATQVLTVVLHQAGIRNVALETAIITLAMTTVILAVGEITPKNLALKNPEKFALRTALPIYYLVWLLWPFVILFTGLSTLVAKILGIKESTHFFTADELRTVLAMSEEEGILEEKETKMIHGIFSFSETIVREVMTPRTDAVCIEKTKTVSQAIRLIKQKGHSRVPVYKDRIDNILGIIYAKDLLGLNPKHPVEKYMRDAVFIPETKTIESHFYQMKKSQSHLAIVMDEYGGMSGLVTLEDIIEEIIGEIQDEYDTKRTPEISSLGDNHYLVDAGVSIDELGKIIHYTFPESDDFDSIGGYVLSVLGKFPSKGEKLSLDQITFIIKDVGKRRIKKIEVKVKPKSDD